MKESELDMNVTIEKGHREVRQTFQQNHDPKLMKMCDKSQKKSELALLIRQRATT